MLLAAAGAPGFPDGNTPAAVAAGFFFLSFFFFLAGLVVVVVVVGTAVVPSPLAPAGTTGVPATLDGFFFVRCILLAARLEAEFGSMCVAVGVVVLVAAVGLGGFLPFPYARQKNTGMKNSLNATPCCVIFVRNVRRCGSRTQARTQCSKAGQIPKR